MKERDIGMDISDLLIVKPSLKDSLSSSSSDYFKKRVQGISSVMSITCSSQIPGKGFNSYWWGIECVNKKYKAVAETQFAIMNADSDFIKTYKISLLAGQNFELTGNNQVIINKQAALMLGFLSVDESIHEILKIGAVNYEIIGVIDNYNHRTSKENVSPLIISNESTTLPYFSIKLEKSKKNLNLEKIESEWKKTYQNSVFDYFF